MTKTHIACAYNYRYSINMNYPVELSPVKEYGGWMEKIS